MTKTVYCAVPEFAAFQGEVDRFLNQVFERRGAQPAQGASGVSLGKDEQGYYLEAAVPGLDLASLQVQAEKQVLRVAGKRAGGGLPAGAKPRLRERSQRDVQFEVRLPEDADHEKIFADYTNGVLTITAPKTEASKPRPIDVRVS
ncbi:MAG: Hsp20/alpha crystallin family protein [Candidatus Hydrogenedentes bacterium]|nr:Hsp20/alpha crystallin family protein [Candidatus Hydrogenedentota bacterium]